MKPALVVLCAWLFFGGTHLLLSSSPIRDALVRQRGERAFTVLYSFVAVFGLAILSAAVARFGGEGAPGLNLAAMPAARWVLGAIAFIGAALVVAGLMNYFRSPMAVLRIRQRSSDRDKPFALRAPEGIELVTRHPFFVGIILLTASHALLASKLAGAVYFAGFAALALAGMPLQDRKLQSRYGDVYSVYLKETSAAPLAGVRRTSLKGLVRQWPALATALFGAGLISALHPLLRLGNGAGFVLLIAAFGLFALIQQLLKSRASIAAGQ